MKKFCSQCGQENLESVKFCAKCGAPFKQGGSEMQNAATINMDQVSSGTVITNSKKSGLLASFRGQKIVLLYLIAFLIVGGAIGGGYYYYHQQQVLLAQEAEQKATEERIAAEKRAQEQREKEADDRVKSGITSALTHLNHNETLLKEMADKINSGNYDRSYFNAQRQTFLNELNRPVELIDTYMMNNDEVTKNEVKAMLELQRLRANMMYDGLNWDKSKFYVGGQYYDDYYAKLKSFKQKYNVE